MPGRCAAHSALDRALCGSRAHRGRCASGARASICDAGPRARASCSPGHRAPCAGGGCTPDCGTGASARGCAAAGVRPSLALWPPRVAAVQVTPAVARVNTTIVWVGGQSDACACPGGAVNGHARVQAGRRPGRSPPCRPAPGASSAAWSVCCSMARAGTVAAGAGGVTGAAGAAAAWGALFTAQTRCSRRREAWSIFFVSNFFKEQFGVSLNNTVQ